MGSPRDQTRDPCIGRQFLYHWATREAHVSVACIAVPTPWLPWLTMAGGLKLGKVRSPLQWMRLYFNTWQECQCFRLWAHFCSIWGKGEKWQGFILGLSWYCSSSLHPGVYIPVTVTFSPLLWLMGGPLHLLFPLLGILLPCILAFLSK